MTNPEFPRRNIPMPVNGPSIIERPSLPVMTGTQPAPGAREPDMLAATRAAVAAAAARPARTEAPAQGVSGDGPQGGAPTPAKPAAADGGDGYVRLRVRVQDGATTISEVGRVAGPLVTSDHMGGAFAYEVTLDGQRLVGDALGDLALRRSFPNPDPTAVAEHGHNIQRKGEYDFTVRIPVAKLPADRLDRVKVALLRVTDSSRPLQAGTRPVADQFPVEVREVSGLSGAPLANELRRALAAPIRPAHA